MQVARNSQVRVRCERTGKYHAAAVDLLMRHLHMLTYLGI